MKTNQRFLQAVNARSLEASREVDEALRHVAERHSLTLAELYGIVQVNLHQEFFTVAMQQQFAEAQQAKKKAKDAEDLKQAGGNDYKAN